MGHDDVPGRGQVKPSFQKVAGQSPCVRREQQAIHPRYNFGKRLPMLG